ncbi:MAG: TRAP transporter large permease subunit [Nitrospirota bacterium]|nr:TRAP transporter large permease subunit [Nitrospirota bacterium]
MIEAVVGIGALVLILMGLPLFVGFGLLSILCYHYIAQIEIASMIAEFYRFVGAPGVMAIPLFTFSGYLLAESGAPKRLVEVSQAFFGWMPAGLAMVCLISCSIFTALTGASGVTIIAIGGLLFPALIEAGYKEKFNLGLLVSNGSLGLLLPPSLPVIIYALVAKVDVEQLFVAGILPCLLLIALLFVYVWFRSAKWNILSQPFHLKHCYESLWRARYEVPLPFIVIGGIYSGLFTAAEAAAITAFYVLVVEVLILRDIPLRKLFSIMQDAMMMVGAIIAILGLALALTNFIIDQQIPMKLFDYLKTVLPNRYAFLIALNVFLLIVGSVMDVFSAIVVTVPLIVPIAQQFGVDPIHLGVIFLVNLEIGFITPPVGINLFISSFRFNRPITELYRASLPFLLVLIVGLLIVTYWEGLSLFLPEISGMRAHDLPAYLRGVR